MTTVFIGGSRRITRLSQAIQSRLDNIIDKGFTVVVGDANGVDKSVQKYFASKHHKNVIVFCMGGACRNNIGNWETRNISPQRAKRDFNYYATKDIQMANEASCGFMIWDAKSKGTLNNIINLLKRQKKVLVYVSLDKSFSTLHSMEDLFPLLTKCDKKTVERFKKELAITHLMLHQQIDLEFARHNEQIGHPLP
ncbi:MAG: hypothetical protein KKH17_05020 [Proteobacteria bacterium]|nr:hypothetical protein [Desulfobacteraceae bacterium]MBU4067641.1 hypothetical protein [Pseudomonadota bacterium]